MKRFGVYIPITGYIYKEVEAEDEKSAEEKALLSELTVDNIEEWETHKEVVSGNVFYGVRRCLEVEELEDYYDTEEDDDE